MPLTLHTRIWDWLPGRADRARVTDAAAIANALTTPVGDVVAALEAMEKTGHAIRDRRTGRRAHHWHRGIPYPAPETPAAEGLW